MKTTRQILFSILMLLLVLPAVQQYTGLISEPPLKGAITTPKTPQLNAKAWFDASFQEQYDDYLEQCIGFRPTFIRINNQIAFTFFDTALANGVVIGKNNYLYEINYIKAYEGTDFVGYDSIDHQVAKARKVQDLLSANGQHFLVVFAPGKATYFPEYIPDKYRVKNKNVTNYMYYSKRLKEEGINFIDFNQWFLQMKDTSKYPLYSKTGIHWTVYGVALSVDSLLKYMERTASIDMVDFGWDGLEISSKPRETDNDIADGMNILFPIKTGPMAYPKIWFHDPPEKVKPNVVAIGDSYYWNIMGSGIAARLFNDNNFWFYNREAHNPNYSAPKSMKELDILAEIKRQNFVILIVTDANLPKFAFGFLEDYLYALEHKDKTSTASPEQREQRIREIIASIRDSKDWSKLVKEKAAKKGISYEEMLRLDAEWVYDNQSMKK